MNQTAQNGLIWSSVLGVTAAVGSYGLACVFPFAAIAALAAVTLPTRQALGLMGAVWAVNQIVGFTLLSYPADAQGFAWSAIIGGAAFLALGAAKLAYGAETRLLSLRTVAALVASIMAYQALMLVAGLGMNAMDSSTPAIVVDIVRNDALWFAGLGALRLALGAALPRWFGSKLAPQVA